jgi:hypothetical protein
MVTEGTGTQQKTVSCFHLSSIHPSWCGGGVAGSLSSGPFLLLHSARLISRWLAGVGLAGVLIWVCSPAGLNGDDNVESTDAYPNANGKGASLFLFVGWFF